MPCYTFFWNFYWHCSCTQQKHIALPQGKSCWHIQWVVNFLIQEAKSSNTVIVVTEQDENQAESEEEESLLDSTQYQQAHTPPASTSATQYILGRKRGGVTIEDVMEDDSVDDSEEEQEEEQASSSSQLQKLIEEAKNTYKSRAGHMPELRPRTSKQVVYPAILQTAKPKGQPVAVMQKQREEWEVEALVGRRINASRNQLQYLVKWKDYSAVYNSWENIDDLFCEQLITQYESNREPEHSLEADIIAAGYCAPLATNVIRYKETKYFLVPYGQGQPSKWCIVGPDRDLTTMRCKNCRHPKVAHHQGHANKVLQAILDPDGCLYGLDIQKLLPNYQRNVHHILEDNSVADVEALEAAELQNLRSLSVAPINLDLDKDVLARMGDLKYHAELRARLHLDPPKPATQTGTCSGGCRYYDEPLSYTSKGTLYTEQGAFPVSTTVYQCSRKNPACNIYYDGQSDGVFNYSGSKCAYSRIYLYLQACRTNTSYIQPPYGFLVYDANR